MKKTLIIRTEEQYVKNSRNADSTVAIEEYMPDLRNLIQQEEKAVFIFEKCSYEELQAI